MNKQAAFTIALVDDHALMRKTVHFRLSRMGYEVTMEAENGKQFLEQLEGAPSPTLCLLDIDMPVMNGFETAVQLKQKWPGIKILFFSMQNSSGYVKKAREIGADGYICKDASTEELNKTLFEVLHKPQVA